MIEERARHVGHADIVRELIDGATGVLGVADGPFPVGERQGLPARFRSRGGVQQSR